MYAIPRKILLVDYNKKRAQGFEVMGHGLDQNISINHADIYL